MVFLKEWKKRKTKVIILLAALLCLSALFYLYQCTHIYCPVSSSYLLWEQEIYCSSPPYDQKLDCSTTPLWEQTINFTCFNNVTGINNGCDLVPNWIHFLRWEDEPMSFIHMICILAAFKHQKPVKIFFHGNTNVSYTGKYWKVLTETPGFLEILEWRYYEPPDSIFGQELSRSWKKFHGSDIARIQIIAKYGGIYLDNDCYLVNNVDYFRRFEIAMSWDEYQFLGSQVIIAHKDARFLTAWLEMYRGCYKKDQWYYNAGQRPTIEVLNNHPEVLHRVKEVFGSDVNYGRKVMHEQWEGWHSMHIIHTFIRHQDEFRDLSPKVTYPVEFDEENILNYPITLRDMANFVYPLKEYKI